MFIDTHCHLNIMVKKEFDVPLTVDQIHAAHIYVDEAAAQEVTTLINVGTNLVESLNSIALAQQYKRVYATVGIHPTDCTDNWKSEFKEIQHLLVDKYHNKIVGIGECGIDLYHPGHNLSRQQDAFKAHIELALEHDVALVVHSRNAPDETLRILDEYKKSITKATMHCFSYDERIAREVIAMGCMIGIDGPITYKKNAELRAVATHIPLEYIVLETDAPFLPPQSIRGQQNHPKYITEIAAFIAGLRGVTVEHIATQTTINARKLFGI